ncbi:MAG: SMC-Scp complex subunit ScpB [Chloroflexi bacterium]|nr:SMC-Scp complex subunit ScpB [Chloroflexota bacterium]
MPSQSAFSELDARLRRWCWLALVFQCQHQNALEALAYEQPVSRADISHIRGTDRTGAVDTLLARGLIVDDARFGGRGRPAFLVTTDRFLQVMGLGSLAELPPRQYGS